MFDPKIHGVHHETQKQITRSQQKKLREREGLLQVFEFLHGDTEPDFLATITEPPEETIPVGYFDNLKKPFKEHYGTRII